MSSSRTFSANRQDIWPRHEGFALRMASQPSLAVKRLGSGEAVDAGRRLGTVSNGQGSAMTLDMILSIAMLGSFIWAVRFMLPKAVKQQDGLALTCAVLTAVLALVAWLLIGVRVRSTNF